MKANYLSGISSAQNEDTKRKQEVFKEVSENNLQMFATGFKNKVTDYKIANKYLLNNLSMDEIRILAIKFFIKNVSETLNEKINTHILNQ